MKGASISVLVPHSVDPRISSNLFTELMTFDCVARGNKSCPSAGLLNEIAVNVHSANPTLFIEQNYDKFETARLVFPQMSFNQSPKLTPAVASSNQTP